MPKSDASASLVGQSSMIERNDDKSDMPSLLGPNVLESKSENSQDYDKTAGQYVLMSASQFKADFIGRVRAAREKNFANQTRFAEGVMEIPQGTYKKYETDTLLPHELISKFCKFCDIGIEWLLTGQGAGPKWQSYSHQPKPRKTKPKPRKKAA